MSGYTTHAAEAISTCRCDIHKIYFRDLTSESLKPRHLYIKFRRAISEIWLQVWVTQSNSGSFNPRKSLAACGSVTAKCSALIEENSSGSRGAEGAMAPAGPVKISHKKDGHQRQPHRFHVSRPPPLPGRWIRYCKILLTGLLLTNLTNYTYCYKRQTIVYFSLFIIKHGYAAQKIKYLEPFKVW